MGLKDLIVKINSRQILQEVAINAGFKLEEVNDICIVVDKIDKIGLDGVQNELLARNFDAKNAKHSVNY